MAWITILTENQIYVIEDFTPCLIPPKSLRDPARVGQASGDTSGVEAVLERLRNAPSERYSRIREEALDRHIDKLEREIGVMTNEEKEAERIRVKGIIEKARKMSKVDFELNKSEMAREIGPMKTSSQKLRKYELSKVGRFMLNARLIPVLETHLAQK